MGVNMDDKLDAAIKENKTVGENVNRIYDYLEKNNVETKKEVYDSIKEIAQRNAINAAFKGLGALGEVIQCKELCIAVAVGSNLMAIKDSISLLDGTLLNDFTSFMNIGTAVLSIAKICMQNN